MYILAAFALKKTTPSYVSIKKYKRKQTFCKAPNGANEKQLIKNN